MGTLTLRAAGRARPGVVWQRYTTPRLWPTWSPYIRRVHATGERITPGARGRVESFLGITAVFVVEEVDEEHRTWSWRVRLGPVRLALRHTVRPQGGGTATSLTLHGAAPVLAAYAPMARLALHRLVQP
ncbi:SRPBCC family protein [Streptomyces sp. NPDC054887]